MPAAIVLLPQTSLLFEHAYWLSAAANRMLAGLWPLNQHACWPFVTQYCLRCASLSAIPAGMVSHYQPYLWVWWIIIGHTFWFGTSILAMPVGVVPHYKSCLLVWCLTVDHVFWCGASLYAMPVGMIIHYRPSLLVRFALQPRFWLVECRPKGVATSLVLVLQMCNYIRNVCWSGATLRYACLYSATLIRHACWVVHLFRYTCL